MISGEKFSVFTRELEELNICPGHSLLKIK